MAVETTITQNSDEPGESDDTHQTDSEDAKSRSRLLNTCLDKTVTGTVTKSHIVPVALTNTGTVKTSKVMGEDTHYVCAHTYSDHGNRIYVRVDESMRKRVAELTDHAQKITLVCGANKYLPHQRLTGDTPPEEHERRVNEILTAENFARNIGAHKIWDDVKPESAHTFLSPNDKENLHQYMGTNNMVGRQQGQSIDIYPDREVLPSTPGEESYDFTYVEHGSDRVKQHIWPVGYLTVNEVEYMNQTINIVTGLHTDRDTAAESIKDSLKQTTTFTLTRQPDTTLDIDNDPPVEYWCGNHYKSLSQDTTRDKEHNTSVDLTGRITAAQPHINAPNTLVDAVRRIQSTSGSQARKAVLAASGLLAGIYLSITLNTAMNSGVPWALLAGVVIGLPILKRITRSTVNYSPTLTHPVISNDILTTNAETSKTHAEWMAEKQRDQQQRAEKKANSTPPTPDIYTTHDNTLSDSTPDTEHSNGEQCTERRDIRSITVTATQNDDRVTLRGTIDGEDVIWVDERGTTGFLSPEFSKLYTKPGFHDEKLPVTVAEITSDMDTDDVDGVVSYCGNWVIQ